MIIIVFWISIYQYDGSTGLLNQPKNKYSKDLKISAIKIILTEGSLRDICGIRSHRGLKVYNSGGILKHPLEHAKNTILDERLKIVTDCLANDKIMVMALVPINKVR